MGKTYQLTNKQILNLPYNPWFIAPENYPSKGSCARGLFSGAMN